MAIAEINRLHSRLLDSVTQKAAKMEKIESQAVQGLVCRLAAMNFRVEIAFLTVAFGYDAALN